MVAPCAVAGVFDQWIDGDGVVRLTDNPAKIPRTDPLRVLAADGQALSSSEDLDLAGHNRAWWKQRVQEWRNRKANAEGKLADARDRLRRERFLDANVGTYLRQQEILAEISAYEEQIREAERMIEEELPEEARKAGAPPGWLRE
jgi:hypothetical protein